MASLSARKRDAPQKPVGYGIVLAELRGSRLDTSPTPLNESEAETARRLPDEDLLCRCNA